MGGLSVVGRFGKGMGELLGVETAVDDVELGPVVGGEEGHELGTGEVGDADDELGGEGFFGEAVVGDIGEFGGAVHGEGEGGGGIFDFGFLIFD